jgi:hypothetical protein
MAQVKRKWHIHKGQNPPSKPGHIACDTKGMQGVAQPLPADVQTPPVRPASHPCSSKEAIC